MKEKFQHYNLELEEVLIGTPASPEGDTNIEIILAQLRDRQIALEQVETYTRQEKAAIKERELREVEARARQQQMLTESEVSISIQTNQGKADYQRSLQQAAQIRALAEAEASKVARVGIAQAMAIEEQVRAYGGPRYQVTQQVMNRFAEAVERSQVDVVPRVLISDRNGGDGHGAATGSVFEALLTLLLAERMGETVSRGGAEGGRAPEVEAIRAQILAELDKRAKGSPDAGTAPAAPMTS
jgi:uncharacterized membrane protein YqiK